MAGERRRVSSSTRSRRERQPPEAAVLAGITALAVSADRASIAVGREGGSLERIEPATGRRVPLPTDPGQGPVEALAISHDGRSLAVAVLSRRLASSRDRPSTSCDIEVRGFPEGLVRTRVATTPNLVLALAFSPDDRLLAYSGGEDHEVTVDRLADRPSPRLNTLRAPGGSSATWPSRSTAGSWDSLLDDDRHRPDTASPTRGFDLERHAPRPCEGEPRRIVSTWRGWSVEPTHPYELRIAGPDGEAVKVSLNPADGRWWSYGLIPPGPDHPDLALAVGQERAIVIVDAKTGRRNRLLSGHEGSVLALAVSPDGRWLASGSSDQTVRLWPLSECNTPPRLGARFGRRPSGGWTVEAVEPRGVAKTMGLLPGDGVVITAIGGRRIEVDEFAQRAEDSTPGTAVELQVKRGDRRLILGTTKTEAPALSLFASDDGDWILWTPHGFYDSSITGDRKHLVWHRNRIAIDQASLAVPAVEYEAHFRKPELVERLFASADPRATLAAYEEQARVMSVARRRLHTLAVGLGTFQDHRIRALPFAREDADDVATALETFGLTRGFDEVIKHTFSAPTVSSRSIAEAFDWLGSRRSSGELRPGDWAVVYVVGHSVTGASGFVLMTPDTRVDHVEGTALPRRRDWRTPEASGRDRGPRAAHDGRHVEGRGPERGAGPRRVGPRQWPPECRRVPRVDRRASFPARRARARQLSPRAFLDVIALRRLAPSGRAIGSRSKNSRNGSRPGYAS